MVTSIKDKSSLDAAKPQYPTVGKGDVESAAPQPGTETERQPYQTGHICKDRLYVAGSHRDHVRHEEIRRMMWLCVQALRQQPT